MKIGTEDRRKLIIACVLGVFALISVVYLYGLLFGGPSTPPPPTTIAAVRPAAAPAKTTAPTSTSSTAKGTAAVPVIGTAAQKIGSTNGQLDPTLHMEAMLRTEALEYSGSGRNIFTGGATELPPPPKMENANFKARPTTAPPVVSQAPVVAGPPPINMKFFGTATSANGTRRAFLIQGDDVILAGVGDVVQRRYRIVSITATSILVEDIPNSNKQTLPLVAN